MAKAPKGKRSGAGTGRGRPQGMDAVNGTQVIKALVPMSEMLEYDRHLRTMTQGRSSFHMEFSTTGSLLSGPGHARGVPEAPAGGARVGLQLSSFEM